MKLNPQMIRYHMQRLPQYLAVLGVAVIAVTVCMVSARAGGLLISQNQSVSDGGQIYVNPDQKFSVYVPRDADVTEPDGTVDLVLRSRSGWNINIQSSPANRALTLEQMAGRFEAKFVGPDKTWTEKLSDKFLDENSYSGQYEGSGSRLQMIIKRTPLWDYAIMFVAPSDAFITSVEVFQQVLASFRPMASSNTQGIIPGTEDVTEDMQAAGSGGGDVASPDQLTRFHDPAMGYAISYPAHWVVSKPDEFTTMFSGKAGGNAEYVFVSIRNVTTFGALTPLGAAEGMLQQLKTQMAYSDANIRHERPVAVTIGQGDLMAQGMQMVSTFRRGDLDYRQWSIVAPRPDSSVLHVWTYMAPLDRFHVFQAIAEKMAGSMTLMAASRQ